MTSKKSWVEKRNCDTSFKIKKIDKKFADIPAHSKMLIVSPPIIDNYVKNIPSSKSVSLKELRDDLAKKYEADKTCPVTTGIFLRIVAEAAYEELESGKTITQITPFWRVINSKMKIASKLACGLNFINFQREKEGLEV
mgnify:CR=1 FL=1